MPAKIAIILDITEDYPEEVHSELEMYWRQWDDKGQNTFCTLYMDDWFEWEDDSGANRKSENSEQFPHLYDYLVDFFEKNNLDTGTTDVFIHIWW